MQARNKKLDCPDIFSGKRVLIIGLGKTGLACVNFLYERGVEFAVTDSRVKPPALQEMKDKYPDVALFLGGFDPQLIESSDVLIVSPGVPVSDPLISAAASNGKQVIGDIEIFAQCTGKPVVAITGSNGKSTVTTLVGEMARLAKKKVKVGGNIGVPVLGLIDEIDETELFVLELSSFQLETTHSLDATASVILNVTEDHMDRYTSFSSYAEAKKRIYHGGGVVVINKDDPYVASLAGTYLKQRKQYFFTLDKPDNDNTFGLLMHDGAQWLARGGQVLLPVSAVKIKGLHNYANVLASLALGTAIDLPVPAMLEAIQTFPGLAHRTQWVAENNGVTWFNDSKATNVGAAIAAINGMPVEKLIVILGGQGKGQDFSPLKPALQQHARHVLILGEDASLIVGCLEKIVPYTIVSDLAEAVLKARGLAKSGDAVLLSPACASFDMFEGYEHRGNTFMQLVEEVTR